MKKLFANKPATKPIIPQDTICHGVHGPWPSNMLEISAAEAPMISPLWGPNAMAEAMMTKVVGWTLGIDANGIRETLAIAAKTASITISLLVIFFLEVRIIDGISIAIINKILINK